MHFVYLKSLSVIDYLKESSLLCKLCSYTVFDSLTFSPFELFNLLMHSVRLSFLNWFDHLNYLCI